ncbi:MAG: ComF family protein [Gemmatimonadetes bacterium]|nr:ComF family protein [Gemmatimonadota bacterium]
MGTNTFLHSLVELLLPPICLGCASGFAAGDPLRLVCARCRSRLRPVPAPGCVRCAAPVLRTERVDGACPECADWPALLAVARAACVLQPPANTLVHALKYRGWPALADPLAGTMARIALPAPARDARICVPVPTTARTLRERGYNQAELLARAFAKQTGRTLMTALTRADRTASQTTLQPAGRRANVAGAFRADAGLRRALAGSDVILIDDVLTTGATAVECARVLGDAGITRVILVTFARALDVRRLDSQQRSRNP